MVLQFSTACSSENSGWKKVARKPRKLDSYVSAYVNHSVSRAQSQRIMVSLWNPPTPHILKRETVSLKVSGVVGGRRYFKKMPTGSLFVSSRQFSLALSLRFCRSSALTAWPRASHRLNFYCFRLLLSDHLTNGQISMFAVCTKWQPSTASLWPHLSPKRTLCLDSHSQQLPLIDQ